MAQFSVYKNTNRRTKKIYPYLLDIQANLLDELHTTVVIHLSPVSITGKETISKLCPAVQIGNKDYIVITPQISGVERKVLGQEVCDLSRCHSEFISAIDFIISGI